MKVKNTKMVAREVVEDVICNKCGKSTFAGQKMMPKMEQFGIDTLMCSGYYSPRLPDDGLYLTFALCEPCVLDLAKTFVIPMYDETSKKEWTEEEVEEMKNKSKEYNEFFNV